MKKAEDADDAAAAALEQSVSEIEDEVSKIEGDSDETDQTDEEGAKGRPAYTREELEGVADESGISGLREIGNALNARSNSIEGLIDAILSAQTAVAQ